MEGTTNDKQKKGLSKGLIALIVGIVVLAGGTALAFMLIKDSPKNAYFLAEKDTLDYMMEQIEERYQPEFDWYEKTQSEKTASSLELTAEYNDPAASSGYGMDPATLINNSSITLDSQTDMENKQVYTGLTANIAGMEISDIEVFVTDEKVMVGLPFIEEVLQLNDEDFGPLLHEVDPVSFTGEETLELDTLFESAGEIFPEEYKTHLEDEYFQLVYDELPDDAFTSSDETVEVNGESINSEKIVLHLSEQQLKDIITTVLDKMENDDKLKEIIKEQMVAQQFGDMYMMDDELDTFIADFEASITEVKASLEELQIPDGLTSTLWIADKKIVQREFVLEMGPSAEELAKVSITGSQLLTDENQFFNYDFTFSDAYEEGTMNIAGDLNWKNNEATDSISLSVEDIVLSYDGTETLADGTREFNRVFTFEEPTSGGGSLHWSGDATYENDRMNSAHQFSIDSPDFSQDLFTLNMNTEGQTIDSVETLSEDNVKDLGSMSATEIQEYFEFEVAPNFQQWLFGIMAGGGMGF